MSLKRIINNSKEIGINDLVRYSYMGDLIKWEYKLARRAYDATAITDFKSKGEIIEQYKILSKFLRYVRRNGLTNLVS
jgi:hypothetical protein